jgi:ribonuclease-3
VNFRDLHTFARPELLQQALTHPTYANQHPGVPTNQRMEFLGDAVLQLIVSEMLLERYGEWDEGRLTKARSRLVDRDHCAALADALGLGAALRTERGLVLAPESKAYADAFEAYVAAVHLDGGLDRARATLGVVLRDAVEQVSAGPLVDAKSRLQEWCQARRLARPVYHMTRDGRAHESRFSVEVEVGGRRFGPTIAPKIKTAEGAAAAVALAALESEGGFGPGAP